MLGRRVSQIFLSTGLLLTVGAINLTHASAVTSATVTGSVFRDDDFSGTRGPRERGQNGIVVTAYDDFNQQVGTTVSGTTGSYTLPVSNAHSNAVRVHFDIPASFTTLKVAGHLSPADQFIDTTGGTVANINFAVTDPRDYCQSSPKLLSACWKYGDQTNNRSAFVSWSASQTGAPSVGGYVAPRGELTENQIGTTFGAAYSNNTSTLFVSAFERRYSGFGPAGTGAIYKVTGAGTSATPSVYADLNGLFGAGTAGVNTHPTGASGATGSPNSSNANANAWWHDIASYDAVTKTSLGDIGLDNNQQNLFVVNLTDRKLYKMSATVKPTVAADVTRATIPLAASGTSQTCAAGDSRPFGLGFHDDMGFIGVVCSAQSTQNTAQLRGYVYRFDPATMAFDALPVVQLDFVALSTARPGSSGRPDTWRPWTSTLPSTGYQDYSQPIIGDILFDGADMLIGMRDRFGDQIADGGGDLNLNSNNPVYIDSWGDILRACSSGSGWAIEVSGTYNTDGSLKTSGTCGGVASGRVRTYSGGGNEAQYSNGSLFQVPGSDVVFTSSMDPASLLNIWDHTGVAQISHTSGLRTTGYAFTMAPNSTSDGLFGKGNGMGALAAMCDKAPVEIAGRVWNDSNGNGMQDAGEIAIPNLSVDLVNAAGTTVASAVSDAKGQYSFSPKVATSSAASIYGVATLTPGSAGWKIRAQVGDPDLAGGLFPTASRTGIGSDLSRSSVINQDGLSDAFTVGGSGVVDTSFGIGFRSILSECAAASLGRSINRSLLVTSTANLTGINTTGSAAIAGNVTMTSGNIGTGLPVDNTRFDLSTNGNVTIGGSLARGNYAYAGTTSGSVTLAPGATPAKQTSPWIGAAITAAQNSSTIWQNASVTGSVTTTTPAAGKTINFSGGLTTINVFTIDRALLATAKHVEINVPNGSLAIINVTGSGTFATSTWVDVNYVGAATDATEARSGLVWNLLGASAITIAGAAPEGLFLAPSAPVTAGGSTVKGTIIANSLVSAGTIQFVPSKLVCITPVPNISVAATTLTTHACAPTTWEFEITPLPSVVPNTIKVTWDDGSVKDVQTSVVTAAHVLYRYSLSLDRSVTAAAAVLPASFNGTLNLLSGPCQGPSPVLSVCLNGNVGDSATSGKFAYNTAGAVQTGVLFKNVMSGGSAAPFTDMTTVATVTKSANYTLTASPITWTLNGVYQTTNVSFGPATAQLPATGTAVTAGNACNPPVVNVLSTPSAPSNAGRPT